MGEKTGNADIAEIAIAAKLYGVETMNLKCGYDMRELIICKKCGSHKMIKKCLCPDLKKPGGCQEESKLKCKGYKSKFNNIITVNEVIIEKLPQIR